MTYLDIEKKILFYKNYITKELIKKGIFPKCGDSSSQFLNVITNSLNNIDKNLSIFKHKDCKTGEYFDTDRYNKELTFIYSDLKILYEVLYNLTVTEYLELKSFADCHLEELENLARNYELKTKEEINSTTLGNTVFFQSNSFNISKYSDCKIVDLGNIELCSGSKIACIINASNIENNKILFYLDNGKDIISSAAYNYNNDSIIVPGKIKNNKYDITISPEQIINSSIPLKIDKEVSEKNIYFIFAGKNKIYYENYDDETFKVNEKKIKNINDLNFEKSGKLKFWTLNAKDITFNFNVNPIKINGIDWKDVKENTFSFTKNINLFTIEYPDNFSMNIELNDGLIYSLVTRGYICNSVLYFPYNEDIKDFHIEEYETGDKKSFHCYIKIFNDFNAPVEIQSVLIKELLNIGDDVLNDSI